MNWRETRDKEEVQHRLAEAGRILLAIHQRRQQRLHPRREAKAKRKGTAR